MTQQHYRMTLQDAINHYQQGDITAKGLLHIYFKIKIAPGWTMNKSQKEICEELGIKKTAFYNALSRLKAEGSINWTVPESTKFSITLSFHNSGNDSAITNDNSAITNEFSAIAESQTRIAENQFANAENKSPKPAPEMTSSDSPDLYSNSSQSFIQSLSQGERENFLKFCQERAFQLPKPPILLTKWIEANAEDLKAQWLNFCGKSDDNSNHQSNKFGIWANHPRFDEMWENVCIHGTTGYVITNIKDKTIKEFCEFCMNSDEITEEILSCLNSH